MDIFVIEMLIEALLLKIVWIMANFVRIFSYTFVTIYYSSLSMIFVLGEFVKFRKATFSFVMSCLSVRQRGTTALSLDGFS
jgi:hypothetical protein